MYIDSHAHISSDELFPHFAALEARAEEASVDTLVNICTDATTLARGITLKERSQRVVLAAATTPHDVHADGDDFFPIVAQAAKSHQLVALGETGLDYYYEHSPKEIQKAFLLRYFQLAQETHLPLIFHCREAFEDLFSLAQSAYAGGPGLIHCFTGTLAEARQALELGFYLSFSGIITFKKSAALREVVRFVPLVNMMIETDSPYLAPQSRRGQVNEPSFLPETAHMIAEIKGISVAEVAAATKKNATAFFSL